MKPARHLTPTVRAKLVVAKAIIVVAMSAATIAFLHALYTLWVAAPKIFWLFIGIIGTIASVAWAGFTLETAGRSYPPPEPKKPEFDPKKVPPPKKAPEDKRSDAQK